MGFDKDLVKSEKTTKNNFSVKKVKYDRIPTYPSKMQSSAFPERVYIFAIQKLILISIILFVVSVILGIAIYYKTFLFKPNPLFIYYSDHEKKFKLKNFYNSGNKQIYHNIQILAEDFLKKWIIDYYSIDEDNNINNSKWCNCFDNKNDKNQNLHCSICSSSDKNVYNVFFEFVKPVKEARYQSEIVRSVKILKIEPFFYGLINHNIAKQSILEEIALTSISAFKESLYPINDKIIPFRSYMFYIKVDFMTADFKNGKHINTEYFTSHNTVSLRLFQNEKGYLGINKDWFNRFIVLEHSANFILHNKYRKTDILDMHKTYNKTNITNQESNPQNIKIITDANKNNTKANKKKNKQKYKNKNRVKKTKINKSKITE